MTDEEPRSFSAPDGRVSLTYDIGNYDFHIDALPGYQASTMAVVLGVAASWGLEPLDEGEADPELLDNGAVRIYLTPIVSEEVREAVALAHDTTTEDLEGIA